MTGTKFRDTTCGGVRSMSPKPSLLPGVESALLAIARRSGMTDCLQQRLIELAAGLTYKEIADAHSIAVSTVKSEVSMLLAVLGVRCRHQIEARSGQRRTGSGWAPRWSRSWSSSTYDLNNFSHIPRRGMTNACLTGIRNRTNVTGTAQGGPVVAGCAPPAGPLFPFALRRPRAEA